MPMYRIEKTLDGSQRISLVRRPGGNWRGRGNRNWMAIVSSAGSSAWRGHAKDRRLQKKVEAMQQAADSGDSNRFLSLSKDFVRCYPNIPMGHAAHADALYNLGQYEPAPRAIYYAVENGFSLYRL